MFKKFNSVTRISLIASVLVFLTACGGEESKPDVAAAGASGNAMAAGRGGPGGSMRGGPGGMGQKGDMQNMPAPAVEVVAARMGSLPLEERLTGRVVAHNQSEIFPEVAGPIEEIFVDDGDHVKEGDPLVRIRDAEYQAAYQQALSGLEIAKAQSLQAEANLALVRSQLERTRELTQRNLDTKASLEQATSQLAIAAADVDLRKAQQAQSQSQLNERLLQLERTVIRAPVDGQVGQRNAERGQYVNASTRLFMIGDLTKIRVEVSLTERMLAYIEQGTPVHIFADVWQGAARESTIARISPFLDSNTLRTQAHIELDNTEMPLRSGMFVTVDVLYGDTERAVLIPNSALYRHPHTGEEGIFVVKAPSPEFKPVPQAVASAPALTPPVPMTFVPIQILATGRMSSGVIGIDEGDWVVTLGQHLLLGQVNEIRARVMDWDLVMKMQRSQSSDLFEVIDQRAQERREG